jgi:hypothetical protein
MASVTQSGSDERSIAQWVERLTTHTQKGETLDLAQTELAGSLEKRSLPALALRQVLTDPDHKVDPRGLRLRVAHIVGALDLRHLKFPHPLHLIDCHLEEVCDLSDAEIAELDMGGSRLPHLILDRAAVSGLVIPIHLPIPEPEAHGGEREPTLEGWRSSHPNPSSVG